MLARPHLWSGASGVIESYNAETTLHRVRIEGRDGAKFSTDAYRDELQEVEGKEEDQGFKNILGL